MRTIFGTGLFLSLFVMSSAASAQTGAAEQPRWILSDQGNVILSAERLFGITYSATSTEQEVGGQTAKSTTSYTNVGLLWSEPNSVYNVARFGLDFTIVDNVTLGFAGGFFSGSSKIKAGSDVQSTERDGPTSTAWLVSPRVGYIVDVSDKIAIWLRGGLSIAGVSQTSEGTGQTPTSSKRSLSGVAITGEPMLVVTPVPHFGLYGGLALDVPLSGTLKSETTQNNVTQSAPDIKVRQSSYGVTFGLLGYL